MKKTILTLAILLCSVSAFAAFGESQYLEAKLGANFPWSIQPGVEGNVAYGIRIDQMVSVNFDFGYYFTSYNNPATNAEPSTGLQSTSLLSSLSANLMMLMVYARIDMPFTIAEIAVPYAQFGVGYDVMINNYQSTSVNNTYVFGGFAIKLDIGTRIKLGDKSALILDVGYNFCTVGRSRSATDTLSVGEKIDVGGFSLLGGISFQI